MGPIVGAWIHKYRNDTVHGGTMAGSYARTDGTRQTRWHRSGTERSGGRNGGAGLYRLSIGNVDKLLFHGKTNIDEQRRIRIFGESALS